jgi:hypothetical protein
MLQALLHDATQKDGTLAPARLPQLIATAVAKAIPVRIAQFAIAATDGSQPAAQAVTMTHTPIIAETGQVSKIGQVSVAVLCDATPGRERCPAGSELRPPESWAKPEQASVVS